ncbi:hypothetical protein D9M68_600550 [compost metagenome]
MAESVKGVLKASTQGQATIITAVKAAQALIELSKYSQYPAALKAMIKTPIVKYLAMRSLKFFRKLSF